LRFVKMNSKMIMMVLMTKTKLMIVKLPNKAALAVTHHSLATPICVRTLKKKPGLLITIPVEFRSGRPRNKDPWGPHSLLTRRYRRLGVDHSPPSSAKVMCVSCLYIHFLMRVAYVSTGTYLSFFISLPDTNFGRHNGES
jgi:hypothetical protein